MKSALPGMIACLVLAPYTFCYSTATTGGCADGIDNDPPSIGSPGEIFVFVPVEQFDELVVHQTTEDDLSGATVTAEAEFLGSGWWVVRPRGPADDYRVSIFASDTDTGVGDMVADVRWQTPSA